MHSWDFHFDCGDFECGDSLKAFCFCFCFCCLRVSCSAIVIEVVVPLSPEEAQDQRELSVQIL